MKKEKQKKSQIKKRKTELCNKGNWLIGQSDGPHIEPVLLQLYWSTDLKVNGKSFMAPTPWNVWWFCRCKEPNPTTTDSVLRVSNLRLRIDAGLKTRASLFVCSHSTSMPSCWWTHPRCRSRWQSHASCKCGPNWHALTTPSLCSKSKFSETCCSLTSFKETFGVTELGNCLAQRNGQNCERDQNHYTHAAASSALPALVDGHRQGL